LARYSSRSKVSAAKLRNAKSSSTMILEAVQDVQMYVFERDTAERLVVPQGAHNCEKLVSGVLRSSQATGPQQLETWIVVRWQTSTRHNLVKTHYFLMIFKVLVLHGLSIWFASLWLCVLQQGAAALT
jgi:hypothetical protein